MINAVPDLKLITEAANGEDAVENVSHVQVLRVICAGARAYRLKGYDRELIETIHAVMEGRKGYGLKVAAELAEHATDDELSERETEVLQLIAAVTVKQTDR